MRHLLLCLTVGSLACASDVALPGGNRLSCETYSYRALLLAGKLDLLDVPARLKQEGIPGISINERYLRSRDAAYVDSLRDAIGRAGRKMVCLVIDGTLAGADEGKRRKQIAHDVESIRIAHRLGAPLVRINVGSTGPAENADDTAGVDRVIAAVREMLPLARELKVRISIENHGGASRSASNILRIIRGADPEWVGALIDFGNFPEQTRYEEVAQLAPHAFAIHVKTGDQGAGYDLDRALRIMRDHQYKGILSIEFGGSGEPLEAVRKARDLIVSKWK